MAQNLPHWLTFIAPWLLVALVAGTVYGLMGWWWRERRPLIVAVLMGLPFLIEPWVWIDWMGYDKGTRLPWIGEWTVGTAVLLVAAMTWLRSLRTVPPDANR
ncbi:DUF6518 family protein [Actinacidiphila soli]|uniref:DUF6518 family protein n=1 Tax=Actinacidiphila soli TaxID=2487275 RepID=UPI0038993615